MVFVVIGIINTFSTTIIATLLDKLAAAVFDGGMPQMLEKLNATFVAAYICSLILSFFLNTFFTFRERPTLKKFIKFPVSYIPNFIIQYIAVWIFKQLGLDPSYAYLLAAVIGIPVTFLVMKLFVYKKKQ